MLHADVGLLVHTPGRSGTVDMRKCCPTPVAYHMARASTLTLAVYVAALAVTTKPSMPLSLMSLCCHIITRPDRMGKPSSRRLAHAWGNDACTAFAWNSFDLVAWCSSHVDDVDNGLV